MTEAVFQAYFARAVTDPRFRRRLAAHGERTLKTESALTARERDRLVTLAMDPGMDAIRTIHKGFRLGKLMPMLPLTCALLGPLRLNREAHAFWKLRPPLTFHFLEEALAFCEFLDERMQSGVLKAAYLDEILVFERAALHLRAAHVMGDEHARQVVRFQHDPEKLMALIAARKRRSRVRVRACTLVGELQGQAEPTWSMLD
jgi:hypothetical protein